MRTITNLKNQKNDTIEGGDAKTFCLLLKEIKKEQGGISLKSVFSARSRHAKERYAQPYSLSSIIAGSRQNFKPKLVYKREWE